MSLSLRRTPAAGLVLVLAGMLVAGVARAGAAERPEPLIIGPLWVLVIRNGDLLNKRRMSIHQRIDHVHDVFAAHLGRQQAKLTARRWGTRLHLYLNGEFVLAVTPADARATGYKSPRQLEPVWMKALARAFEEAHARKPVEEY